MNRILVGLCAVMVFSCGQQPPSDADVVATSSEGKVRVSEVEAILRTIPGVVESAARDDLVAAYRAAAETIVCERLLVPETVDLDAVESELGEEYQRVRRAVVLDEYRMRELSPPVIERSDVEDYFELHRDEFFREAQRYLWHIFLRHEDPQDPDRTVERIGELRTRALGGESFDRLAREHSDSETRLLGGRIGWVGRGRMPSEIEDVVFAMGKGDISEPLLVRGGAVLLMVSEVVIEKQMELEDVAGLIDERLRLEAALARIDELLAEYQLPEDAYLIPDESLLAVLAATGVDDPVVKIAGHRVTAGEFAEIIEERGQKVPGLPFVRNNPQLFYSAVVADLKLYDHLLQGEFTHRPEVRQAIDAQLVRHARSELFRRRMESEIMDSVSRREVELADFFDNNRFLYQSPLRMKLRMLSVSIGSDVDRLTDRIRQTRQELVDGTVQLEAAARRFGVEVRELGWMTSQQLERIDPKVKVYVLDLRGPGWTVPFQLNRQLHLIQVEQWSDPEPLEFAAVEEQVRRDYMHRHQQEIYREVMDRMLANADFRFYQEAVARVLSGAP